MAKRRPFKKTKPGKPIPVTARELESFMLEHKGKFNSRDYDKFERMELTESPVRGRRPDVVARLCMVVDWRIDHPECTTKIKVIPKKDYPILMPCEF